VRDRAAGTRRERARDAGQHRDDLVRGWQGLHQGREGEWRLKRTTARTDTGRVRDGNEDRFVVRESGGTLLMAVADGVGGGPGGEIAAAAAVEELAARFFSATTGGPVEERLADAMRDANTAVLRAADASDKPQAASTLVAVAVQGSRAVIANLGDSRAYLVRAGASRQLTDDHSAGVAHGITRFVGDPRGVQPDIFVEELLVGDRLLLCSDGLTRHVELAEIAQRAGAADTDRAVEDLVALANARGGEDNVTVVLYLADPRAGSAAARPRRFGVALLAAIVVLVAGGAIASLVSVALQAPPAATASPSASPTPSDTPSPSPTPSESPTPTPTESPTPTPTP
jgi:protein phosphatase